jgi:hypothetical protein
VSASILFPPQLEEDIEGLAITTEKESSRLRLFGEHHLITEAMMMITTLLDSMKFNKQVAYISVSASAASMLAGIQGLQLLAKLSSEAGSSCQLVNEDGTPCIKSVGTPAANLAVRKSVQQLEARAWSCNRQLMDLSDAALLDSICQVCLCEVAPTNRHIMEPCGHVYCQDCAKEYVKSQVSQSKFPVVCCKAGCKQPVCLEDMKLLLGPATEYGRALGLSLASYMRCNAGAGIRPCLTPDCKQVRVGAVQDLMYNCLQAQRWFLLRAFQTDFNDAQITAQSSSFAPSSQNMHLTAASWFLLLSGVQGSSAEARV